jgi:hypothetical protein
MRENREGAKTQRLRKASIAGQMKPQITQIGADPPPTHENHKDTKKTAVDRGMWSVELRHPRRSRGQQLRRTPLQERALVEVPVATAAPPAEGCRRLVCHVVYEEGMAVLLLQDIK